MPAPADAAPMTPVSRPGRLSKLTSPVATLSEERYPSLYGTPSYSAIFQEGLDPEPGPGQYESFGSFGNQYLAHHCSEPAVGAGLLQFREPVLAHHCSEAAVGEGRVVRNRRYSEPAVGGRVHPR